MKSNTRFSQQQKSFFIYSLFTVCRIKKTHELLSQCWREIQLLHLHTARKGSQISTFHSLSSSCFMFQLSVAFIGLNCFSWSPHNHQPSKTPRQRFLSYIRASQETVVKARISKSQRFHKRAESFSFFLLCLLITTAPSTRGTFSFFSKYNRKNAKYRHK